MKAAVFRPNSPGSGEEPVSGHATGRVHVHDRLCSKVRVHDRSGRVRRPVVSSCSGTCWSVWFPIVGVRFPDTDLFPRTSGMSFPEGLALDRLVVGSYPGRAFLCLGVYRD